jgi:hypothetical protein
LWPSGTCGWTNFALLWKKSYNLFRMESILYESLNTYVTSMFGSRLGRFSIRLANLQVPLFPVKYMSFCSPDSKMNWKFIVWVRLLRLFTTFVICKKNSNLAEVVHIPW